jgi:hypothetical protein
MAKISRLIKKQKHYNFVRDYGSFVGNPQFDVRQYRRAPQGWMTRLISVRAYWRSRGSWEFTGPNDPRPYYSVQMKRWYTPMGLCAVKKKLKDIGYDYRPA